MKSKTKLLAFVLTLIGCVILTSVGYSIYTITGSTNKEVSIPVNKIETSYLENLYAFKRINPNKQIRYETNHNIIIDDVMEIELTYKASKLTTLYDLYSNSGLLISLSVLDNRLYEHLKNHICYYQDFLSIKSNSGSHICSSNNVYRYYMGDLALKCEMDCFTYNDVTKEIMIHIPTDIEREVVENMFSISSIYPSLTDTTITLSFDFHLVDEKLSEKFTLDNFNLNGQNLFNINISMEMYN